MAEAAAGPSVLPSTAGEAGTVRMEGRSMGPLYRPGTRLRLRPVDGRERLLGSVVVFHRHGRWLAHRVIAERGDVLVCRGDGNWHSERVHRSDVVSVVAGRSGFARALDALPSSVERLVGRGSLRLRRLGASLRSRGARAAG